MSERVEEGIAAGNSAFSERCKCIWNTPHVSGYENMDSCGDF